MRFGLLLLVACSGGGEDPAPDGAGDDDDDDVVDDTDDPETGATGETAPTGDTGPVGEVFDCNSIPFQPISFTQIAGPRGYHDIAFSPSGLAIGQGSQGFNPDLLAADYYGNVSVFSPSLGGTQQMVWLPDGDLAVAHDALGILRVAPNGGYTVINPDIRPYGLILGPDQMLYSANQNQVHRVDPATGASQVLVASGALSRGSPRVINFSLDYSQLFIGTYQGSNGRLYVVDLDAALDPIGQPREFVSGVGVGSYHDTLGVDLCGYLYVADYNTSAMFRISPSGDQVQRLFEASGFIGSEYGHGLDWGNGVGGWDEFAIYITQPYANNQVAEVVIGVPSREWTGGTAINLP